MMDVTKEEGTAMKWRTNTARFTEAEWRIFQQSRLRYQREHDFWTTRELAHLRVLSWLVETGRLDLAGAPKGKAARDGERSILTNGE